MSEELTYYEKEHLERIFKTHREKIEQKINEELLILSKYKGDLARGYSEVAGYKNTLAGCMQDIIKYQEELMWLMRDLHKAITGHYPQHAAKTIGEVCITPEKYSPHSFEIDKNIPIDVLFDSASISKKLIITKTIRALVAEGITHIYMLKEQTAIKLLKIPNLGVKSLAYIIYYAKYFGIEIPYKGYCFNTIKRYIKEIEDEQSNKPIQNE